MVSSRGFAVLLAALFAAGCAGTVLGEIGASGSAMRGFLDARDVVLITAFRNLGGVAADARVAYAAGPEGVIRYDQRFRRWEAPITRDDGYPVDEIPTALAVDRFARSLWLGTRSGGVYEFPLGLRSGWRWAGVAPGGAIRTLVPGENGVFALTGVGWSYADAGVGGVGPAPAVPADVARQAEPLLRRMAAEDASFAASLTGALTDERLRRWEPTAAAEGPGGTDEFWIGTWGGGLFLYDDLSLRATHYPFGLVGRGVGAMAVAEDGTLWFGGDGLGERRGVTGADAQLQRWVWLEAPFERVPQGLVRDALATEDAAWFAASDGLYRVSGGQGRRWTDADGLPSARATALARVGDAIWVGTERGLAVVRDGIAQRTGGVGAPAVTGLAVTGDSLVWIGTTRGLAVARARDGEPVPIPGTAAGQGARGVTIVDVADAGERVHVLAEGRVTTWDANGLLNALGVEVPRQIGRPLTLAADRSGVWVGGTTGVAFLDPVSGSAGTLLVPQQIPEGPIRQVLPAGDAVWLATPAGAVRLPR